MVLRGHRRCAGAPIALRLGGAGALGLGVLITLAGKVSMRGSVHCWVGARRANIYAIN